MLSVVLIVKNEEKNLARCLNSIKGLGTELVIVDTGSTDKTVEIAKSFTDNVYHFVWIKNFAAARNYSFSKCTQPWIMWLDADDVLHQKDVEVLKKNFDFLKNNPHVDYILMNYHYSVAVAPDAGDKGWSEKDVALATLLRERIVRKEKGIWNGRCHEHIMIDFCRSVTIDACVWHMRTEEDIKADFQRNIELMKLEVMENSNDRNYFYLAQELMDCGKFQESLENNQKVFQITTNPDLKFQSAYRSGICYKNLNQIDLAIDWFLNSIKEHVDYREPFVELAGLYFFKKKDFKKSAQWLEASLKISAPEHPFMAIQKTYYTWLPYDLLAKCYFEMKQFKNSIEASEKLYEITRIETVLADIERAKIELKKTYKNPTGTVKLNLGCGGKPEPGYTNCDLFPGPGIDEVFSLDEVPYADATVDEITSEHALEHLPRPRSHAAIGEWARVLKPGGVLKLKIPDIELCCEQYLKDIVNRDSWYLHTIYGVQDFRNEPKTPFKDKVNYGQIHYTGYNKKTISELVSKNGLVIEDIHNYDGYSTPSISITAKKIISQNAKKIAFINNTLIPRYLSYGDYWLDAFKAAGHQVTEFRYESVANLPAGFDYYFFIEKRYEPSEINSAARPRILYTQENPSQEVLKYFDYVCTSDFLRSALWSRENNCLVVPNTDWTNGVKKIMDWVSGAAPATINKPVDIIIPSYKNLKYLQLTIESVRKNTTNYNLIICNSGEDEEVRNYLQSQTDIKLIDTKERRSFSQNINAGIRLSDNDVVLLNNDVVVGKNWLEALRTSPYDITNPYSNCDQGWIHNFTENVGGVNLHPNMTVDQVNLDALFNYQSLRSEVISRPWIAFYATYIKRNVINATGILDETFLNGGEDFDYCRRAEKLGFTCGHVFSSWVFHFGGKTRKVSEQENYQKHHEEDAFNQSVMNHRTKKTVGIFCGPAWEKWTINNINTTGIGGSETCAALLAKELVEKDYRVLLIGDCEGLEGNYDGVEYYDWRKYEKLIDTNYFDYFISSRTLQPFSFPLRSKKNFVWVHDIWLSSNRFLPDTSKVSKFICLSPWHIDFFSQHHLIPKNRIYIQPNGLDTSRFKNVNVEKDPYRLFYSSSPDRGLHTLLLNFSGLKERFPKLNLHVYYGFFNWKSAIEQRKDPRELAYLQDIERLMKQDGVFYHDRVPQNVLAQEQMKASLWVYPTNFTETYCLSVVEAMLAGAVPVCNSLAALETTLPDSCGIKVKTPEECFPETIKLLDNPELQEPYRTKGKEYAFKNCDWSNVVNNWVEMFEEV